MANGTTIDRLGIEFVSRLAPDFGRNVEEAIKQFMVLSHPKVFKQRETFRTNPSQVIFKYN
jgi:NAD-specific glutamate dehydrogenase